MQQTEHEDEQPVGVPTDSHSHPLQPIALPQVDESDDPEQIFVRAVAEIDTQPLVLPKKQVNLFWQNVLEILVCLGMVGSLIGLVYQIITYPHTLVILYAKEHPASITVTLALPTRILAPVTVTYSHTAPTSGHEHQDARVASGRLTFYNGSASQQTIARGTVITGGDGVQVRTDQAVTLPAANPPTFGQATLTATTLQTGSRANIPAYDLNGTVSDSVFVKNLSAFTGGRDVRDYKAVAQQDLIALTSALTTTLTQALTHAFPLRQGEQDIPTQCHTTTSANHQPGQEAQSVTPTASKTCSAVAYHQDELAREATTAFTRTKPAANYHIAGSVQATIQSVLPLSATISGKWAYTFSPAYEQLLAQLIAGDTPAQARKVLLRTGVISYASIPSSLPPEAMYINFLVLVG